MPGQLLHLSTERIAFGNLPLHSRMRRLVVLSNRSTQHEAHFSWHVTAHADAQVAGQRVRRVRCFGIERGEISNIKRDVAN